jgi:hypothetical protein
MISKRGLLNIVGAQTQTRATTTRQQQPIGRIEGKSDEYRTLSLSWK